MKKKLFCHKLINLTSGFIGDLEVYFKNPEDIDLFERFEVSFISFHLTPFSQYKRTDEPISVSDFRKEDDKWIFPRQSIVEHLNTPDNINKYLNKITLSGRFKSFPKNFICDREGNQYGNEVSGVYFTDDFYTSSCESVDKFAYFATDIGVFQDLETIIIEPKNRNSSATLPTVRDTIDKLQKIVMPPIEHNFVQ